MRHRTARADVAPRTVTDGDELFIRARLALYLDRVLAKQAKLDRETLTFLLWLVDGVAMVMTHVIRSKLSGRDREAFEEQLADCEDADDCTRAVMRAIGRKRALEPPCVKAIRKELRALRQRPRHAEPAFIEESFGRAAKSLGLTETEAEYCLFIYLVGAWPPVNSYFEDHLFCTAAHGRKHLATVLDLGPGELVNVLHGKIDTLKIIDHSGAWTRMSEDFLPLFTSPPGTDFEKWLFRRALPPEVPLSAHFVEQAETDRLVALLRVRPEEGPVHILLYGPPGNGKTSYARGLAHAAGVPAYELLPHTDNKAAGQRSALLACLNMTNQEEGSITIVDEADRLIGTEVGWFFQGETQDKGWLNHLLDQPGVRMIWICNSVTAVADSVRRRFAHSIRFRAFGRQQRLRIWESVVDKHEVKDILPGSALVSLASDYPVGAGPIDVAVRTAKATASESHDAMLCAIRSALESHQTLMAGGRRPRRPDDVAEQFVLEALSVEGDLAALMRRIEGADRELRCGGATRGLTMLFHGPSGTGKSELAKQIARRLDRTPVLRRASDILSKWVGESEQNLAATFCEADERDDLLILDEVDTFLYPRGMAQHSWEISLVNEFLTQMESFQGLLVCTTNRLAGLDSACSRRFNVKLGFNYLDADGRNLLYERLLAPLVASAAAESDLRALANILRLAAGDFRVVRDRFEVQESTTHAELVAALAEEASIRRVQEGQTAAGFRVS